MERRGTHSKPRARWVWFPRAVVLDVALAIFAAGCAPSFPPPPETRVVEVSDTLHGVAFPDPYRWLEDGSSPDTRTWIQEQNAYAETIIGQSPLRDRIEARLRELMDVADADAPRRAGGYEYFTLRRKGQELPVVYRRPAPDEMEEPVDPEGEYEVVLDPHGLSPENTTQFDIVGFSPDGALMIYNDRDGGQDEVRIRIRDLAHGSDLPDSLPNALYGSVFFSDDGNGLYYVRRSRETGPRLLHHVMGTDIAGDRVIFGDGYGPECFLDVSQAGGGRYLVYSVQHGWARTEIYVQDLRRGGPPRPIVVDADARFYARFIDGELYLRTDLGADRNHLVAVDLAHPEPERWREVIPEAEDVMEGFTRIGERFYVTYLHDASNRIRVFEEDGTPAGELEVPELHSASIRAGRNGTALLTLSSFTTPPTVYEVDLDTDERSVWDPPDLDWDASGLVVEQAWRTSKDGTRAPLFVVHRRDVELDGDNPTLLTGYGGFYAARKPGFNTMAALWLEMGGVYAVATLRGGSEFGESWHRDGMLENKQHVFDDFISAAQWLIDTGYTSAEKLAILGTSNGGLLVGAALTQRPDLFRAVLCGFPDVDILRFFTYTRNNNAPALLEYGDSRIPEQFEAIRLYSPYQNVRAGTSYPAVMLFSGDLDTRVPPAAARKITARLQAARSDRPVILRYHHKAGHAASRGLPLGRRIADAAAELTFVVQQLGVAVES